MNEQQQREQQTTLVWFIGQDQNKEKKVISFPPHLYPLTFERILCQQTTDRSMFRRKFSHTYRPSRKKIALLPGVRVWQPLELLRKYNINPKNKTMLPPSVPFLCFLCVALAAEDKENRAEDLEKIDLSKHLSLINQSQNPSTVEEGNNDLEWTIVNCKIKFSPCLNCRSSSMVNWNFFKWSWRNIDRYWHDWANCVSWRITRSEPVGRRTSPVSRRRRRKDEFLRAWRRIEVECGVTFSLIISLKTDRCREEISKKQGDSLLLAQWCFKSIEEMSSIIDLKLAHQLHFRLTFIGTIFHRDIWKESRVIHNGFSPSPCCVHRQCWADKIQSILTVYQTKNRSMSSLDSALSFLFFSFRGRDVRWSLIFHSRGMKQLHWSKWGCSSSFLHWPAQGFAIRRRFQFNLFHRSMEDIHINEYQAGFLT